MFIDIWLKETNEMTDNKAAVTNGIFPIGEENNAYAQFFVGQSYLKTLVADPNVNVGVGNVTFEPGTRNNWHIHHDGFQILLVTAGEVWSREAEMPAHDRSLITVSALLAQGLLPQLEAHMQIAKQNGVTKTEMVELITQLAFYAGWPKAWSAFNMAKEIYK